MKKRLLFMGMCLVAFLGFQQQSIAQCATNQSSVTLSIDFSGDNFPDEDGWRLINVTDGVVVDSACFTTYATSTGIETITFCLDTAKMYVVYAYDDFGDGLDGSVWNLDYTFGTPIDTFGTNNFNIAQTLCTPAYTNNEVADSSIAFTVVYVAPPACLDPVTNAASSIGSDSAIVSWSDLNMATTWEVEWDLAGFTMGTGANSMIVSPDTFLALTGLMSSTSYDWNVRAICSANDTSGWTAGTTFTTAFACPVGAICETYTAGTINSDFGFTGLPGTSTCPGSLTLNIPAGDKIDSITTFYDITASNGAWMSEQVSMLYNPATMTSEPAVAQGAGNTGGTFSYLRTGLTFATNATGAVAIEMHAGRTFGGAACDPNLNDVDSASWTVVAYHSAIPACQAPQALTVGSVGLDTAVVGWTDPNPTAAASYEVSYGATGFTAGMGTQMVTSNNPYTITGLSSGTSYDFYVRAFCSATDSSGWSLAGSFNTLNGIPYTQDFEGFPGGSNITSEGWSNSAGATTPDWTADNGGTGSTATGPDFDHTLGNAAGIYVYLETSGGALGDRDTLTSAPLVVSSAQTALTLTYWYHMAGATMGQMQVWVESGGIWDSITTYDSAQHASTTAAWLVGSHNLNNYAGQTITMRFIGERGSSFTGDAAIDDVSIIETPSCLAPTALTSANPTLTTVDLDWTENNSATDWDIEYGPSGFTQGTGTTVNATAKPYTLSGLSPSTTYDFYVTSNCGPGNVSPQSFSGSFSTLNGVPYFQDFEGFGSVSSEGWSNTATGNPVWIADAGGTPSGGTGPIVDHTLGTNLGRYIFLETSTPSAAGLTDTLFSSTVFVGATQSILELSYWYHFHGATVGSMEVWVIDSAGNGALINTIVGQQHPIQTDPWLLDKQVLTGYQGQAIEIAFVGIAGGSFTGDIAIDDVRLDIPPPNEIGVTDIIDPTSGCGKTATESVTVEITNFGSAAQTNFMIGYALNGVAITPETVTASVPVGGTLNYTFTTTADLSTPGAYDIDVYTLLAADADNSNDSDDVRVNSFATVSSFPYATSFESGADNWVATGDADWELGVPAGVTINSASDGTQAWVTDLDANHGDGRFGAVNSPCFDFTGITNPFISLDIWYDIESNWDGALLQATTDNGATWVTVGDLNDPVNWYNDSANVFVTLGIAPDGTAWTGDGSASGVPGSMGWINASHYLDGYGGMPSVQLRMLFASDANTNNDGMAFDNVEIYDRDPFYTIDIINTEDATTGVADSIGVTCWTSGIVVGIDLDGNNGISFTITDEVTTGTQEGMNIFNFNDVSGYVVTEGDEIMVHGSILQFRGLTELSPDSIVVMSSGNAIPSPMVVTDLDESTESRWLSIPTNFVVLNASGTGSSNVSLTNGTDTITMRIDADTDINDSLNASRALMPGDTICGLFGTGGQFNSSTSAPFTDGYQIFPMRWSDITICRVSTIGIDEAENASSIFSISPNPTNGQFVIETSGFNNSTVVVTVRDLNGRLISNESINNASNAFTKSFDLSDNAKGVYFITIQDGETLINEKLIIK